MGKRKVKIRKRVKKRAVNKKAAKELVKKKRQSKSGSTSKPARDAHGQLLPGNTANPKGRPKGTFSLTTILKHILQKHKGKSKQTQGEALMKDLLKHAKKGSPKLFAIIMERIDGKVPDHLITTETGPLSEIDEAKLNEIINAGNDKPEDNDDPE